MPVSYERQRIEILARIHDSSRGDVIIGIGDDAAVLASPEGELAASVDAAVEGTHFDRAWIGRGATWEDVGYRAAVAALSDLAAMGAEPRGMLSSLTLARDDDDDVLIGIATGIERAASRFGAPVVGGNLSAAPIVSLTTTVLGALRRDLVALRRDRARPGDELWVSGTLGLSSLGLTALLSGAASDPRAQPLVRRFLAPAPRFDAAREIREVARAAIDLSDGLVIDCERLVHASGVAARLRPGGWVPPQEDAIFSASSLEAALYGGEDYELLVAVPPGSPMRGWHRVGEIIAGPPGELWMEDGDRLERLSPRGFDHFERQP